MTLQWCSESTLTLVFARSTSRTCVSNEGIKPVDAIYMSDWLGHTRFNRSTSFNHK